LLVLFRASFLRRQGSIYFNRRLKYKIDNGFEQEKHLYHFESIAETLFQQYQIPAFAGMTHGIDFFS
jgi:virulence-associated protein VapD